MCTFSLDTEYSSFLSSQMYLPIINVKVHVHSAFYMQICIFIRKNLSIYFKLLTCLHCLSSRVSHWTQMFHTLLRQPFSLQHWNLSELPSMKYFLIKTTSICWWGISVKTRLLDRTTWDGDARWQPCNEVQQWVHGGLSLSEPPS